MNIKPAEQIPAGIAKTMETRYHS